MQFVGKMVFAASMPFAALCAATLSTGEEIPDGGVAMNINVVSPETLRDAQKHPEKYENLQVRVAGWNIRWNDIPRKEQDEYIARIETVGNNL